MHILAIDTATNSGGVALSREGELIGLILLKTPLKYSEKIIDMVNFLLDQQGLSLKEIDCFAVATGPGSFTGLRIGLATVKAFAQSLDRPVVGISTLKALAYRFRRLHHRIAPMIDARRRQIFGAVYRIENCRITLEREEEVRAPAEWVDTLPEDCLFVGDGAWNYREVILSREADARILETDNRLLEELCHLAHVRFENAEVISAEKLEANYIRPSDAELSSGTSLR